MHMWSYMLPSHSMGFWLQPMGRKRKTNSTNKLSFCTLYDCSTVITTVYTVYVPFLDTVRFDWFTRNLFPTKCVMQEGCNILATCLTHSVRPTFVCGWKQTLQSRSTHGDECDTRLMLKHTVNKLQYCLTERDLWKGHLVIFKLPHLHDNLRGWNDSRYSTNTNLQPILNHTA